MKKVLAVFLLSIVLASCGKNSPILPEPTPPTPSTEEPGKKEGNKDNPDEPSQKATVSKEETARYLGLSYAKGVEEACRMVNAHSKAEQEIDGRKIKLSAIRIVERKDLTGSLTLQVEGTVNAQAFEQQTFTFEGFATPEAYLIGQRSHAPQWKVEKDVYLKEFDFETLFLTPGSTDKFNTAYLARFVDFSSSYFLAGSVSDVVNYTFTEEDLKSVDIQDIRYESTGYIAFKTSYKGHASSSFSRLPFDRNEYYALKVSLEPEFFKGKYARGVYEKLDVFYGHALKYDNDRYAAVLSESNKSYSESTASITFEVKLRQQGSETLLATFSKTLTGLKPLSALKDEMHIVGSYDLMEYMRKNNFLQKAKDGDVTQLLSATVRSWVKKARIELKDSQRTSDLNWTSVNAQGGKVDALLPEDTSFGYMDIYLERPIFSLVSAELKEGDLKVKLSLDSVNDTALDNVTFEFTVFRVKTAS